MIGRKSPAAPDSKVRPSVNRHVYRTLLVAASSAWLACGQAPPADLAPAVAAPRLQAIEFTGSASPATGRFQIATGPQAAIGTITEDAN